ncbi:hypothetical protein KZP23_11865 [Echinicola marina]|uniref:hypothetical protein n=1 Tax=Echinicola marina TaxID=2859768 RepID=UPI001CF6B56B|nr:hypothetical protein [Echinicola marina]UCS95657.1 hypothetical protein KZP23_11865 [Echinicola marina]
MKTLSDNWIVEGWIDFEYKKYLLLAYLKQVDRHFSKAKLYPPLADLVRHYETLMGFSNKKEMLKQAFPKRLTGVDYKKAELKKTMDMPDDEMMRELEEIMAYSIPKIKEQIEQGKTIYELIESNLEIEPIGLSPIYQKEGYVFFSFDHSSEIFIYRYKVKLFENSFEKLRGIAFSYLDKQKNSLAHSFEQIKLELVKTNRDLPNPATWRVHSKKQVPLLETVVPISKKALMKKIA